MNNSRFVLALAAVLFASLAVVALSQPVVGGWQPVASEDETVQDLVQVRRDSFPSFHSLLALVAAPCSRVSLYSLSEVPISNAIVMW